MLINHVYLSLSGMVCLEFAHHFSTGILYSDTCFANVDDLRDYPYWIASLVDLVREGNASGQFARVPHDERAIAILAHCCSEEDGNHGQFMTEKLVRGIREYREA